MRPLRIAAPWSGGAIRFRHQPTVAGVAARPDSGLSAGAFKNCAARSSMISSALVTRASRYLSSSSGMDEEGLDHLALLVRVLEHMPGVGAVPLPLEADVLHHGEKGAAVRRVDQIFDDRQDRSLIVRDPIGEGRRAPAHRRGQILRLARLQLPSPM